jgi:hypothetical protein
MRRLRARTTRERVIILSANLAGALVGAAIFAGLGGLFDDDQGWSGFAFFAVTMFVISQYQPELTKLFREWDR